MNITFENPDKVNGLLTITVEKEDYQEKVEKTLKDYRKRAQVPGFRKGMVPMGMIKKQYGMAVKIEEINKLLGDTLSNYIYENKIAVLGEPMASESQEPQSFEKDEPFVFKFDIAIAPEFKAELTNKDTIDYYTINIDDKLIDQQVQMYAQQSGEMQSAEVFSGNDTLTGDLRELDADGNTKEGGITVDSAQLMPAYIKAEDQKKLFDGCKLGDIITFNPKKAYPDNDTEIAAMLKMDKEQVKDLTCDFSFQVTGIRHFQPAEVNQKLFDRVFGEGKVNGEKEFRQNVANVLKSQFVQNSDYRFLLDMRSYIEQKVGELQFPEALLRRFMQLKNKEKSAEEIDKMYEGSIRELKWHLIKEQLAKANEIKVENNDVKVIVRQAVRQQFAQYGMTDVPEDVIDNYADEQLKKGENIDGYVDRAIDQKLMEKLKTVVKLNEKSVSLDDFNKLFQ